MILNMGGTKAFDDSKPAAASRGFGGHPVAEEYGLLSIHQLLAMLG